MRDSIEIKGKCYNIARFIFCRNYGLPLNLSRRFVVHHINGNVNDNRIENLDFLTQAKHIKHHHTGANRGNRYRICIVCKKEFDARYKSRHKQTETRGHCCSRHCGAILRERNKKMARDHRVGLGVGYVECSICARTIRQSDAIMQRGFLVCPDDFDDLGASGEDPTIGGFVYQFGNTEYGVLVGYPGMMSHGEYGEITDNDGFPVSITNEYGVILDSPNPLERVA